MQEYLEFRNLAAIEPLAQVRNVLCYDPAHRWHLVVRPGSAPSSLYLICKQTCYRLID